MEEEKYDIKKFLLIKKIYIKLLNDKSNSNLTSGFAVFAEALLQHKFSSQQELSNYIGCNKAHTSRMVLKMHIKGLIKQPCKTLELTEKGKIFAEDVKKAKLQLKKQLFANIAEHDAKAFFRVLDQIILNARTVYQQ